MNFTDKDISMPILNKSIETSTPNTEVLPIHAYSSSDITSLLDKQGIQVLLNQEDNRLLTEVGKTYGWKVKSKNFLQKHLGMKSNKKLKLLAARDSLSHSYGDLTERKESRALEKHVLRNRQIFKKPHSTDGASMTRVLVRSVMVAPFATLDSIIEYNDTPPASRKPSKKGGYELAKLPAISIEALPEEVTVESRSYYNRESNISTTSISTGSVSSFSSGNEFDQDDDDDDDDAITTSGNTGQSELETVSYMGKHILQNSFF